MQKVKIKSAEDMEKLKIGETYEVEEWVPEIIEEYNVKIIIKDGKAQIPLTNELYKKLKGMKITITKA
jgi:hypothetical protein